MGPLPGEGAVGKCQFRVAKFLGFCFSQHGRVSFLFEAGPFPFCRDGVKGTKGDPPFFGVYLLLKQTPTAVSGSGSETRGTEFSAYQRAST